MRRLDDAREVRRALDDPARLCSALGLLDGAKRQGGGVLIRCPAHDDAKPSCSVTRGPDGTIRVRCFACDFAGDVFSLVAVVERLDVRRDFREVLHEAARIAGVRLDEHETSARGRAPFARPVAVRRIESLPDAPRDVVPFSAIVAPVLHVGRLDGSPRSAVVTSYLASRGLLDEARADGWADLGARSEADALAGMLLDVFGEHARGAGLVSIAGAFVRPENRVCIPWRDPAGTVATLQRRRLDAGEPRYVFPTGRAPSWPYGVEALASAPADAAIAFVEGAVDVLAMRALNQRAGGRVVALGVPGVSAWHASWARLARGRRVIVATDGDAAGERAGARILEDVRQAGATEARRGRPSSGKDWAEALVSQGAA